MGKAAVLGASLFLLTGLPGALADVDVGAGVVLGGDGVQEFHLALSQHYSVPRETVVVIHERNIPHGHLPVVFFLAQRAKVSPEAIVSLRLSGKSWIGVAMHFGLNATIFHVPVAGDYGPPYGRALGHFKNRKRSAWASIQLTDSDVVHLVNVKFCSKHYGYAPDEVIKLWRKGDSFLTLNSRVKARWAKGKAKYSLGKPGPGPKHFGRAQKKQLRGTAAVKRGAGKVKIEARGKGRKK